MKKHQPSELTLRLGKVCRCGHTAAYHWRGKGEILDCAKCDCRKFMETSNLALIEGSQKRIVTSLDGG